MATKYRKIDPRIWRDERFARLPPEEKLVALYCLTAQTNRCGIFVFSPAMAAEELGMPPGNHGGRVGGKGGGNPPGTFPVLFQRVVSALRWRWDEATRVLYLPTWWKYNPPESNNVLVGNLKDLDDLPQTPLLKEFYANTRYVPEAMRVTLGQGYPQPSPEPSPIQEQEQEQEQEQTPAGAGGAGGRAKAADGGRKPATAPEADPRFGRFWASYPRHEKRADAAKAFAKLDPDPELFARILAAIETQKRCGCLERRFTSEGRSTIPHPTSWLNQRRWEDEPPAAHPADQPMGPPPDFGSDFSRPSTEAPS